MQCINKKVLIFEKNREFYNNNAFMSVKRFKKEYGISDTTLKLYNNEHWYICSCGECRNCLINKRYFLQKRLENETLNWKYKVFITLTYNDDHNPFWLIKKDVQNFNKYLRKIMKGVKYKYFACGEYGDKSLRPHYHLIIFTNDIKYLESGLVHIKTKNDTDYYYSPVVDKAWRSKGFNICTIDRGYVNKYVLKYTTKSNQRFLKYKFKTDLQALRNKLYEDHIFGFDAYAIIDNFINDYDQDFKKPPTFYIYSKSLGYVNCAVEPELAPKYQLKKYIKDLQFSIVTQEKTLKELENDAAVIYWKNQVNSLFIKNKTQFSDIEFKNTNKKGAI